MRDARVMVFWVGCRTAAFEGQASLPLGKLVRMRVGENGVVFDSGRYWLDNIHGRDRYFAQMLVAAEKLVDEPDRDHFGHWGWLSAVYAKYVYRAAPRYLEIALNKMASRHHVHLAN